MPHRESGRGLGMHLHREWLRFPRTSSGPSGRVSGGRRGPGARQRGARPGVVVLHVCLRPDMYGLMTVLSRGCPLLFVLPFVAVVVALPLV